MNTRRSIGVLATALCGVMALTTSTGCQSTHTRTTIYESDNAHRPVKQDRAEAESEWKMVSPGEMVVDP